ncbi:AMP-binding protein [Streptomyces sp. 8N616]|uniref:AMP-binding protein n=1 Tax=Streptomyces sp. 8N616 TaxID=3457414 RepID=UPI003FD3E0C0
MSGPHITPGDLFRNARDLLLEHGEDLEMAHRAFRWPELTDFNWALDWFDPLAHDNPATALWLVTDSGDQRISFAELHRRSDQVAVWLRGRGVRRGDPLLLLLGNRPELWETMLAAIKLGAVVVPTYTTATPADLADRLTRADVRHVIAEAQLTARFAALPGEWNRICVGGRRPGWTPYEESFDAAADFRADGPTPGGDPLFLYFTSGTTSRPKMVCHTHISYPVGHLSGMYWNGLRPGDVHLNISAPGWAKHAWSSFFVPWNAEAAVVVLAPSRGDVPGILDALRTRPITTFCAPPTVWRGLVRRGLGARPPRLREVTSAGEPLDPSVFHAVQDAWGLGVRDGYGQTETTAQIGNPPGRPVLPGRMGWPLPGYRVAVLDPETGQPVPEGAVGELCVDLADRPTGVMASYAGDPRRTAAAFAGGKYHTGDLVVRASDGSLSYIGRADDMFKSFDHRISPLELERSLLGHPAVADAAVVPVPHPIGQWVPKAVVVAAAGWAPDQDTARAVLAAVRRDLPAEKHVHVVAFADVLPRTVSGKIRRAELRASHARSGPEFHTDDLFDTRPDATAAVVD